MSPGARKPTIWILNRSDTNQAVQPLKMARGWKFWIYEVEGLYYPSSENKGTDQLRGYRGADLRLCFRICKTLVFSRRGSNKIICLAGLNLSSTYFSYNVDIEYYETDDPTVFDFTAITEESDCHFLPQEVLSISRSDSD